MTTSAPEDNEFFRIENIAYDVGQIFGSTTDQGLARARRSIYRAALYIVGQDRRWTWLKTKDSLLTVASQREYSLRDDISDLQQQMWMEGSNRGRIDRIPTSDFVQRVPNPEEATGTPVLYDEEGVDSSGAKVVSFYPVPSSEIEIFYRFTRQIMPFNDPSEDIRTIWGMPAKMLEPLTQKAAALCVQGVSSSRFNDMNALAEALILDAYGSDQAKPATTFRAPMIRERDSLSDGVMLPPQFGRD